MNGGSGTSEIKYKCLIYVYWQFQKQGMGEWYRKVFGEILAKIGERHKIINSK